MIQRFSPDYDWKTLIKVFQPARSSAVRLLEEEFIRRSGHSEAIAYLYGRSGLYFLLKTLDQPGKEVILPSSTCVVVAHSIVLAGYKPVFLDNSQDSRQPSSAQFLEAITENTIMVIPTHLYGIPQETKSLYMEIKNSRPDVFVLQDCAHSFFCRDSAGTVVTKHGDGAIFGMNISKLANSAKGGILTLKDPQLAERVRRWTQNKFQSSSVLCRLYVFAAAVAFSKPFSTILLLLRRKTKFLSSVTDYYKESSVDLPSDFQNRLNSFSAEIGLISLKRYDRRVTKRQEIAQHYTRILAQIDSPKILWFPPNIPGATWSHYPVLVSAQNRDTIINELEKELDCEIGVIVDYSVADLEAYRKAGHRTCINAKLEVGQIINLPLTWFEPNLAPTMKAQKVKGIIEQSLFKVFGKRDESL